MSSSVRIYGPFCPPSAVLTPPGLPPLVSIFHWEGLPHEVTLVKPTLAAYNGDARPVYLIGDKALDSDPIDARLAAAGVELIAPHRADRKAPKTQDGRPLRRYTRRWKVERLFAWLQNFRRMLARHEYSPENSLGFASLDCTVILLRGYL